MAFCVRFTVSSLASLSLQIENKKKRANLTDFERYKVMVARQKRTKIIKAAM